MKYDFLCDNCDKEFEISCRMDERDDEFGCPYCDSVNTNRMPSAPRVFDSESYTMNVGRKEFHTRLNEIHKKTAGSKLDKTSDGIK